MESFGNSSIQGSVPMNPMMAMIQRQQQEQQQYEALTAGTTMGVTSGGGMSQNNTTVMNSPQTTAPPPSTTSTSTASYMNTAQQLAFSQDQFQRHIPSTGSLQQRTSQQMNEITTVYSQTRLSSTEMNSIPMQPTLMQQQQHQPIFNVDNLSPSHSPAPNHTQFYSNVDMQSSYYSEPSMADLQTSYMNIVPPVIMQSGMDSVTSTYMPLHQSMPHTNNYMVNTSNYPHMSYSPVPQMFMANTTNDAYGSALSHPPTSMKMGYPDQSSNLTSMPVQTPTMPTSSDQHHLQQQQRVTRRNSSSRSMASPTTPTHPPPPATATADGRYKHPPDSTPTTVTYIPKTRQVEWHGGVDLKYFEKFDIRPAIPSLEELGAVDLTALTMSLKSGTKMEMTNALNTLTTMTMQPRPLLLVHCEDLLDVILDHLQGCLFDENPTAVVAGAEASSHSYADLFELALLEMKSLIPGLEPTSSETWLSSRELRLCLFNLLRNLSFMEENLEYLSNHPRLCPLLINTIQLTRQYRIRIDKDDGNLIAITIANDDDDNNNNSNNNNTNTNTKLLRCMDILEFRKCVLTIYANIAIAITTPQHEPDTMVDALVFLIHDFVVYGTDTYYAMLAMEAWNKFSVHDSHRRILGSLLHDDGQPVGHLIQGIWVALVSMIRRQFYLVEMGMMVGMSSGQLGTLELVMMGLYNVVALADLAFCEQLIEADPSVAMTLLRICLTLAEANNHHFRIVAQRGMETVYALILGGGVKVTHLVKQQQQYGRTYQQLHTARKQQQQQQQQPSAIVFPVTCADLDDEEPNYKKGVSLRATNLLNTTVLQEKLMMAMLKPSSDNFILSGLNDFLDLMADMSFYD